MDKTPETTGISLEDPAKKLPAYRELRGYTLDPGFSTLLDTSPINETIYRIKWEQVEPGPIGEYFEIIDYDPPSSCYYEPIDLNSDQVLAERGLNPSEGNPQFHQQFVYVIVMKTLECFQQSLGRQIVWRHFWESKYSKNPAEHDKITKQLKAFKDLPYDGDPKKLAARDALLTKKFKLEYIQRIRIYPHAFREPNAYYTPEKASICFGYFQAGQQIQGTNLPGGVVFSCLSPDIVSHEVTHAILDSIHPRFVENTNQDVPAFHEAFADLIALLQRFTNRDLVEHQLTRTRGRLDEFNLLGELATQFGNAVAVGRGALRSAIGKTVNGKWTRLQPDPTQYNEVFEPHTRGAILVAVIFDAFIRLYKYKTQDLFRIAGFGGIDDGRPFSVDLIRRLTDEVTETARHLLQICIRALDYCPPLDITFGDYLRALITADVDVAPADNQGYRIALIEAFRAWGIFPDRVNTLSVESLCWSNQPNLFTKEEQDCLNALTKFLQPEIKGLTGITKREDLAVQTRLAQARLHDHIMNMSRRSMAKDSWRTFLKKLGLTAGDVKFDYEGKKISVAGIKLEVHNIRPAYRIGREGRQVDQVIVTLTQTVEFKEPSLEGFKFRGGCTLVLNLSDEYKVEYIIMKSVDSQWRFNFQLNYRNGDIPESQPLTDSMYDQDMSFGAINFCNLHLH